MRNLIIFIWKNYFFFLFLILEAFSLFMISRNNYYQRTVLINSTSDFTGSLLESYRNFWEYLSLKDANKILAEENAQFYNRQPSSFIKNDTNTFYFRDTLYKRQYSYISAKVIGNSTNRRNNYLKLNKGQIHGVKKDMAVITSTGLVGQVVEASKHFCSVMAVINTHTRISARLKASSQIGTLRWDGNDYRIGTLVDIPSHVQIHIGDSVITSGYSYIYPEGHLIGTVEDFRIERGDSFYTIDVRFSIDYNKVFYVYIVKNYFQDELLRLERNEMKE